MNQEKIGKIIKYHRTKLGLTQNELGERLGVTSKTVSRWENANYMPDISLLIPLSKELNVTLNELLDGNESTIEEKIVDVAKKEINKKKKIIFILEVIILVILMIILFSMFYKLYIDNFYKDIKYDKNKISCNFKSDNVEIIFNDFLPFNYSKNEIIYKENLYIFINASLNYKQIKNKYTTTSIYNNEINNKNIFIYYTEYKDIYNNNLEELLKKSILICNN